MDSFISDWPRAGAVGRSLVAAVGAPIARTRAHPALSTQYLSAGSSYGRDGRPSGTLGRALRFVVRAPFAAASAVRIGAAVSGGALSRGSRLMALMCYTAAIRQPLSGRRRSARRLFTHRGRRSSSATTVGGDDEPQATRQRNFKLETYRPRRGLSAPVMRRRRLPGRVTAIRARSARLASAGTITAAQITHYGWPPESSLCD